MKTTIVKKETIPCKAEFTLYVLENKDLYVEVASDNDNVAIVFDRMSHTLKFVMPPDAARKFANMIFAVANEVKDEWADMRGDRDLFTPKKPVVNKTPGSLHQVNNFGFCFEDCPACRAKKKKKPTKRSTKKNG